MSRPTLVSRLARSPRGALCALFLIGLVLCAIFAPWIAPYDYEALKLAMANTPPSAAHWLGTDEFGRDLLSRIIQGARTSLSVSVLSIALSVMAGATLGAAAG
jgi:peptide/nickel transport system permease protein